MHFRTTHRDTTHKRHEVWGLHTPPFSVSHWGRRLGGGFDRPIGVWDPGAVYLLPSPVYLSPGSRYSFPPLGTMVPGPGVKSMFGERDCVYNVHLCLSLRWVSAEYLHMCA